MTSRRTPELLCLTGPTASGKSALARAIADRWPTEIINVDSATIYRNMDIGTAKPDQRERTNYAHHLLDIRDPAQSYSAAAFRVDALRCIAEIQARGKLPLLVGGTMLYFKALREGLNDLPQADSGLRAELEQRAAQFGWPALHATLANVDPQTAARLSPNDSQRVGRALEIFYLTGQTMSDLIRNTPSTDQPVSTMTISLEPSDRSALHGRIAERFNAMLDAGLVTEVAALYARPDLDTRLPSIRCVGYRQLWSMLDGEISVDEATDQAIAATRQLAKRQLTWLRSLPGRHIFDCLNDKSCDNVISLVARHLDELDLKS
jgi:tRNA dimethylallyltransferase